MADRKFGGDRSDTSNKVRELLDTLPVNTSRVPKWVLKAVRNAIKNGKLPKREIGPLPTAGDAIEYALGQLGRNWADHFGVIKFNDYEYLVSEPYAHRINVESLAELQRFVDLFGGVYWFSSNSGHYPGRTLRIVIAENEDRLIEFQQRDYAESLKRKRVKLS